MNLSNSYTQTQSSKRLRVRDLGYRPGRFNPGSKNSILDVPGLKVGQATLHEESGIHTGVTIIFPRGLEDTALHPCYAATHDLNGAGELTGCHMLREWGYLRAPIAITNSLSVGKVYDYIFLWSLEQAVARGEDDLEAIRRFSIPLVGETFDGYLNDIRASAIGRDAVRQAIQAAETQPDVLEGNHGGGTGMICHGYKGGTGTSSRVVPGVDRDYVVGVLVQANYGKRDDLKIGNVPVGEMLVEMARAEEGAQKLPAGGKAVEGSIIVIIATDAPLLPHQLRRLAQHAGVGVVQVGGHASGRNFSGEIFLALSTGNSSVDELAHDSSGMGFLPKLETQKMEQVKNETIDSLLYAVSEATEEAILNAMCMAETLTGYMGRRVDALPLDKVQRLLDQHLYQRK